jgi:phosphoketolase
MTVLNDLDRFHLVMDTIDRLPQTGRKGLYLKQQLKVLVQRRAWCGHLYASSAAGWPGWDTWRVPDSRAKPITAIVDGARVRLCVR